MPRINVKLYAALRKFMPEGAERNAIRLQYPDDATVTSVLDDLNVPREHCHLVVVNGVFVPPEERASTKLSDNDTLAVWPPVAGG